MRVRASAGEYNKSQVSLGHSHYFLPRARKEAAEENARGTSYGWEGEEGDLAAHVYVLIRHF